MKKSTKIWLIVVSIVVAVVLAVTLTIVLVNKNKEFASAEVDGIKFEMLNHKEHNKLTLVDDTYTYSVVLTIRLVITNDTPDELGIPNQIRFSLKSKNYDGNTFLFKSIKNIDTGEVIETKDASGEYLTVMQAGTQCIYDLVFESKVFTETDNGDPESLLKQKINDNYTTLANLNRKGTTFTVGFMLNHNFHTILKQKLRLSCFNYDDLINNIDNSESV